MKIKRITKLVNNYTETKIVEGLTFKKGAEFFITNSILKVDIAISGNTDTHIVYLHVVDGQIVYVGESSNTFRNRMRLYITHDGLTNARVRLFIKNVLSKGKRVETYYFKPDCVLISNTLVVNPYVGLEQELISRINPKPILNRKDVAKKD